MGHQSPEKPTARRHSAEEKAAAVRMVRTLRKELSSEHGTIQRVAIQLGYGVESVRLWVRQADINDGYGPGVSTAAARRIKELEQENRELRTTMVLDALEIALWSRGTTLPGLRCHSDAGSQFTSARYEERLAEIGAVPSIGTAGDSFGNALAETVNGLIQDRTGLRAGPRWTLEDCRGPRTGHPGGGALAQHQPSARLPRGPATRRVRSRVYDAERTDHTLVEIA